MNAPAALRDRTRWTGATPRSYFRCFQTPSPEILDDDFFDAAAFAGAGFQRLQTPYRASPHTGYTYAAARRQKVRLRRPSAGADFQNDVRSSLGSCGGAHAELLFERRQLDMIRLNSSLALPSCRLVPCVKMACRFPPLLWITFDTDQILDDRSQACLLPVSCCRRVQRTTSTSARPPGASKR